MLLSLNITEMVMKSGLNCDLIAFNVWKSHKANNKILRAWKVMMVLKCFELAELALLKMTFNEGAFLGNSTESILPLHLVGFFFSVTEKIWNKKAWNGIFAFVFVCSKNTQLFLRDVLYFFVQDFSFSHVCSWLSLRSAIFLNMF